MNESVIAIEWEAHPHLPQTHGSDWFWMLGIIGVSASVAAFIWGNVLFGIVIILGILLMIAYARFDTNETVSYRISPSGIEIDTKVYPFLKLDSFWIDREHYLGPHLILRRAEGLDAILVIPLPEEYTEDAYELLASNVPEEHMEEPLSKKLFEFIGF